MKYPALVLLPLVTLFAAASSGCAVFTKGSKQTVIVRSLPSGAVAKINGTPVGKTPFKVNLERDEVFRVDIEKVGFAAESALLMPTAEEYEQRFLRWGIDYDLGRTTDLIPSELLVEMKPAMGAASNGDRFSEMTAQINRADAMWASGQLSVADYRYLIEQISTNYHNSL
jgi:PEGA domain